MRDEDIKRIGEIREYLTATQNLLPNRDEVVLLFTYIDFLKAELRDWQTSPNFNATGLTSDQP